MTGVGAGGTERRTAGGTDAAAGGLRKAIQAATAKKATATMPNKPEMAAAAMMIAVVFNTPPNPIVFQSGPFRDLG